MSNPNRITCRNKTRTDNDVFTEVLKEQKKFNTLRKIVENYDNRHGQQ